MINNLLLLLLRNGMEQFWTMKNGKAVLVVAHGSRSNDAVAEFEKVVGLVRTKISESVVKGAHMELAEPDIATATKELADEGVKEIVVVPYFLFMGNHIKQDIPDIINEQRLLYPQIKFKLGKPFGADSLIAELLEKRIIETVNQWNSNTLLR